MIVFIVLTFWLTVSSSNKHPDDLQWTNDLQSNTPRASTKISTYQPSKLIFRNNLTYTYTSISKTQSTRWTADAKVMPALIAPTRFGHKSSFQVSDFNFHNNHTCIWSRKFFKLVSTFHSLLHDGSMPWSSFLNVRQAHLSLHLFTFSCNFVLPSPSPRVVSSYTSRVIDISSSNLDFVVPPFRFHDVPLQ